MIPEDSRDCPTIRQVLGSAGFVVAADLHVMPHEPGVAIAGDEVCWSPGERFQGWLPWAGMIDEERVIVLAVTVDELPDEPRLVDAAHVAALSLCCVERVVPVGENDDEITSRWHPVGPVHYGAVEYRGPGTERVRFDLRGDLVDAGAWWPRGLLAWRGAQMLHQARRPDVPAVAAVAG